MPKTLRKPAELAAARLVAPELLPALEKVAGRYAVAITPAIAGLIDRDDPADPVGRQFVPDPAELATAPDELADPIGDFAHAPVKGIVHRYPDRVLLKPLHACPVYCRYCFRREQVGPGGEALDDAELDAALAYIAGRPEIFEVILTGGDPLMLAPRRLRVILRRLAEIPHLGVIRLHSRVPVADPARIDEALTEALALEQPAVWLAVHINHARELSPPALDACRRLTRAGIPLLGQTVLLNGVNADPAVLEDLFRAMARARIKPYYLHHPDPAPGTARFRLDLAEGQALMRRIQGRVSGLCQPAYVLDLPGGHGKVPVGPAYHRQVADGTWQLRDFRGQEHAWPPLSAPGSDKAVAARSRSRTAAGGRDRASSPAHPARPAAPANRA
ncbi:MAG: lysine-2,3-aminomutase-like protein [Alphaproteobacteria bacterium]|nr:lysine-2,3-aminomutase-like protein [Alphaproteobacteria bacterium]